MVERVLKPGVSKSPAEEGNFRSLYSLLFAAFERFGFESLFEVCENCLALLQTNRN
jgi:hypothetical protein